MHITKQNLTKLIRENILYEQENSVPFQMSFEPIDVERKLDIMNRIVKSDVTSDTFVAENKWLKIAGLI